MKAVEKNNWARKEDQGIWESKQDDRERWEEKKCDDKANPGIWDPEKRLEKFSMYPLSDDQ